MNFQDGSSVLQRQLLLQFGDRLRRLRKARKLSTVEMAKRVGISRTTLSAVEAGDPAPSIGTYLRVMAELGIGADLALLAGDVISPAPADSAAARVVCEGGSAVAAQRTSGAGHGIYGQHASQRTGFAELGAARGSGQVCTLAPVSAAGGKTDP